MPLKDRLGFDKDPVYLVDGHSFIYRAFYAFPDLARSDGTPSNALFIILRILLKLLREERPQAIGFFLDGKGKTFRNDLYEDYKANRPSMPEGLSVQIEPIRQAATLLGMKVVTAEDGEADDYIACMASRLKKERPVVIVASDKDLKQCLDENVVMWDPGTNKEKLVTLQGFREETGLSPDQWPDFQALIGDSSDNIPGVPGVGPKTAQKIMAEHPTLEALRDNVESLKPPPRKEIEPHMDMAFTYRELTRLRTDLCEDLKGEDLLAERPDFGEVLEFLKTWEFRSLQRELPEIAAELGIAAPSAAPTGESEQGPPDEGAQGSLFDTSCAAPPCISAADIDELPETQGMVVAVVAGDQGIHLAVGEDEVLYTGPEAPLLKHIGAAREIVAPSLKELLRRKACWFELPMEKCFDISLAAYLLNPEERSYEPSAVARRFAAELPPVEGLGDGRLALELAELLAERLKNAQLMELMQKLEAPLTAVLARMEERGVAVDETAFASFLHDVETELESLTAAVYADAGKEFNLRSSQQLADILFTDLGLKPKGKTPGGKPSTSESVLERLRSEHPLVGRILDYRKLEKLRSTYLAPLPKLMDKAGRIHTTFNQLSTATGRLSSSGPNLQNIPIRGEQGPRMRACFTAAPGKLLTSADYSQVELRVLAHFSQEPTLIEAFQHGLDIHSRTAALLFDKDPGDPQAVTREERATAKTINFGLIYGMGPQKMSIDLSITLNEAKAFIARYFERLSGLKSFYETIEERCKEQGFVITLAGRRRLLPDINSKSPNLQSQARRQAINTVIQGSAADIIKMAMLAAEGDAVLKGLGAELILQVHDELLLEVPEAEAEAAGKRLAELMSQVVELRVPLLVDWGSGRNWAEAH
jgi:DNA polymerase-1